VLKNSHSRLSGFTHGQAFVSEATDNTPTSHCVHLASLVVARFSLPSEVIWDLCVDRPLLALPMSAMWMARYYVCIGGLAESYEKMVDTLQSCEYLKSECALIYDGRWESNEGAYAKITVSPLILSISLLRLHVFILPTPTHTPPPW
jgi:hypothetical protein